jgi:hypothetical protein
VAGQIKSAPDLMDIGARQQIRKRLCAMPHIKKSRFGLIFVKKLDDII